MVRPVLSCGAAIVLGIVVGFNLPVPQPMGDLRAWTNTDGTAESRTLDHRLIGFACGPERLTMTAAEEDHFPKCDAIEAIEDVCPTPKEGQWSDEPVTAAECARYMGDGY